MRVLKLSSLGLLFVALIGFFACQKNASDNPELTSAAKKKGALDAPTISCVGSSGAGITINVKAGLSGAPAGFSVQWMLQSEYDANITAGGMGWPSSSDVVSTSSFCKASFSGVPGSSNYNLAGGANINVTIGDVIYDEVGASSPCENMPLMCGKAYIFRAFAHNDPASGIGKSEWSANQTCSTLACSETTSCTYTQGYWKTHGPVPMGNNQNEWDVTTLTLGSVPYTDLQLLSIFNTAAKGNGLITLSHQLIAAKLNVANGASLPGDVAQAIEDADALIGSLIVPPVVGAGYLEPSTTSTVSGKLAAYNEGLTGPGHCN